MSADATHRFQPFQINQVLSWLKKLINQTNPKRFFPNRTRKNPTNQNNQTRLIPIEHVPGQFVNRCLIQSRELEFMKLATKKCQFYFRERFEETDLCWNATNTGWAWLLADNFFYIWSVGAGAFAHYNCQKLTSKETMQTLEAYPITTATLNISKYVEALGEEDLTNDKFPNLKYCVAGGDKVNKQLIRDWKEKTGVELFDLYGQTEIVCFFKIMLAVLIRVRACSHWSDLVPF